MTLKPKPRQASLVTPRKVDELANAVFTALTHDLGRPFIAGGRNVRSVVKQWDPLSQEDPPADWVAFLCSYAPAHFFDRYFYADELSSATHLEDQALRKFRGNLGRGYIANNFKLRFLPYGRLNSVLKSASLEIQQILGEFDTEVWYSHCTHGPNATIGVRKDQAYLPDKFKALDGTLPAITLFKDYLEWNFHLKEYLEPFMAENSVMYVEVSGSRLSFVPKKFDSLRTMMVEPTINQFLQLGLGSYMSECLRRRGNINLGDQPEVHRQLVQLITRFDLPIATVDWSQASDRIWLALCELCLPSDWFAVLSDVRSPVTTYRGEVLHLTMAGSMGCGFTFPLQTLLFLCLLRALARENGHEEFVTVFGDDCIVDSSMEEDIAWLAKELDWQMNADKSFFRGPFRESCGMDAYRGMGVRPFFIERPSDCNSPHALCAWAYGVYNQAADLVWSVPGSTPKHLTSWLGSFLESLGQEILPVPPRFSETSGLRTLDPFSPEFVKLTRGFAVSPVLENYFYPYCGTHFSFIGPARVSVEQEQLPYYIWKLSGKGIPQDFKRQVLCLEESGEDLAYKPGHVPRKGSSAIVQKPGFVYTWTY